MSDTVVLPNGLEVRIRAAWAAGLPEPAGLPVEAPGDVRVLLVHHSVSANDYEPDAVAPLIRSFHDLHTGPSKRWPDVAYNFFIDRFGTVWEGRAGSLRAPVIGDATGGNQGFSQLACLIGDFRYEPPSDAAQGRLVLLLAHLASTYDVDPTPGATATFTSRGSNRWPAGSTVTTTTIAGHRDVSRTECPGDQAYELVRASLPAQVAALVAASATTTTSAPTTTTTTVAPTTEPPTTRGPEPTTATHERDDSPGFPLPAIGAGGIAAGAALAFVLRRRMRAGRRG